MTHSFPTRRSSDLLSTAFPQPIHEITKEQVNKFKLDRLKIVKPSTVRTQLRSEEHTSELQSLMRISYAVFCLKKKNKDDTRAHQSLNRSYHSLTYIH